MRRFPIRAVLLLAVVGVSALILAKLPWVRSLFRRDAENPAEMAQLVSAKLAPAPVADTATGWPQWRGPHRDGRAPAGPLRTDWDKRPPKQLWSVPGGKGFGSFAVVGGRLYVHDRVGGDERLLCLDAGTGKTAWEYRYPVEYAKMDKNFANGPRATPTVARGRVYVVGGTGLFLCVQPPDDPGGTPKELWRHDLPAEFDAEVPQWGVACSPLVEGDAVVVQPGGAKGSVAAFDATTGQLRWAAGTNPAGYSSPVAATVSGRRLVYALAGDALLCVSADGKLLATYPFKTDFKGNIATPVVVDDYVFISAAYNHGCALLRAVPAGDGVRLEEVYSRANKLMRNHHSTCVYKDGFLYGYDDERLKCVNLRTGRENADWDSGGLKKGSLILADRHLIVLTESGDLALVDAKSDDFDLVAKVPSGLDGAKNWALPVLVDGRLYLRDDSTVLCLDVRP